MGRLRALSTAIAIAALIAASGRATTSSRAPVAPARPGSLPAQALLANAIDAPTLDVPAAIRAIVDSTGAAASGHLTSGERQELQTVYQSGGYTPLWADRTGHPNAVAREALAVLDHAADDGLVPADYDVGELGRLTSRLHARDHGLRLQATDVAAFDVVLSAAMVRHLRHLHVGRVDPRAIGFRLNAPVDRHDFAAVLRDAAARGSIATMMSQFRPSDTQYAGLRRMLSEYRLLAADETLELPPLPTVKAVRPGDSYPGAGVLARLLIAVGDLRRDEAPPATSDRYEGSLVDAVKRFQLRHGIAVDGVLGPQTIAALRIPLAWRVRQIELALERLRWLPHASDARRILVNIPMFRLWAWDEGSEGEASFGLDVIVGRALSTHTPVFVEEMREVIFRPYWNIPTSILRNEILPKIERDPGYLQRNDMEIVAYDSRGEPRIRQRPGPRNSLGLIKFVFPNQENVYMHGTPAQELFSRSRRDFSHGCVRVSDPVVLAEWALADNPFWTREEILAAMAGSQTIHVRLTRPIEVILFYTTAVVSPEDGTLRLADDIYRHDARLDRALAASDPER